MLLNEFIKEYRKVEQEEATISQIRSTAAKQEAAITHLKCAIVQQQKDFESMVAQQQKEIKTLAASLEQQASLFQKVSDQLEAAKNLSRMIVENP